mmetsp:Transcript_2375/g.7328  ORF Transcript_2375/g.7328 Transcript_2375/m.7328 type:complete len:237 (-) Transcript_2375:186-896(-)
MARVEEQQELGRAQAAAAWAVRSTVRERRLDRGRARRAGGGVGGLERVGARDARGQRVAAAAAGSRVLEVRSADGDGDGSRRDGGGDASAVLLRAALAAAAAPRRGLPPARLAVVDPGRGQVRAPDRVRAAVRPRLGSRPAAVDRRAGPAANPGARGAPSRVRASLGPLVARLQGGLRHRRQRREFLDPHEPSRPRVRKGLRQDCRADVLRRSLDERRRQRARRRQGRLARHRAHR